MAVVPKMLTSKVLLVRRDKGEGVRGTVMEEEGVARVWWMVSLVQLSSCVQKEMISCAYSVCVLDRRDLRWWV